MPTSVVPIFRIFDYEKAVEFYVTWLGFKIDWEHKFDEESPLYIQVSRDGMFCICQSITVTVHRVPKLTLPLMMFEVITKRSKKRSTNFAIRDWKWRRACMPKCRYSGTQAWNAPCFEVMDRFGNKLLITEVGKK